jgi:hypothetical protein
MNRLPDGRPSEEQAGRKSPLSAEAGLAPEPLHVRRRWPVGGLAVIWLCFLLLRVPPLVHQAGGTDEEWYAVPGWTVAYEGIPRIPFVPERNRESVFWKADIALFALPPALHYVQAPFFWMLPAGYPTARLVSLLAALLALVLIFQLGRRLLKNDSAALLGAAIFSLSRVCYFPAIHARPDMLCALFGLAALLCILQWQAQGSWKWQIGGGVCLGLAGLSHPVAIVFAVQMAVFLLLADPRPWWHRLSGVLVLGGGAVATFSLWLPLILSHPDIFRQQFFSNVLNRTTPADGVVSSVIPILEHQFQLLCEHMGPCQLLLCGLGLIGMTLFAWRAKDAPGRSLVLLTWLAVCLLIGFEGRHPIKEYWCYPGALLSLCAAGTLWKCGNCLQIRWRRPVPHLAMAGVALLLLLPGSGIRASATYLRHWGEPDYCAGRFIRQVLEKMPLDGVFVVDTGYVFDVFLSGRKTLLANNTPMYFQVSAFPYDYLLVSRDARDKRISAVLKAVPLARYGAASDPFHCEVETFHTP